jgi:hypothetical protein
MSAIEYGLIAACVLIAIITAANGVGTKLKATLAELTAIRRDSHPAAVARAASVAAAIRPVI